RDQGKSDRGNRSAARRAGERGEKSVRTGTVPGAEKEARRIRPRTRLRQPDRDRDQPARPGHPTAHRPRPLPLRQRHAEAPGDAPPERDLRPRQPRPQPPDLGRGQHRRRAHRDLGIPQQLGAFRGPRDGRRDLHDRPRSGGEAARSQRRRRRAADRPEHRRRRARTQPPGRNSPAARQQSGRRLAAMKGRKALIIIGVVALVVAGLAYKMVLAPKSESKVKVEGTVYVMPKEFLLNLAGGRYAKMTVALVLAPGQSTTGSSETPPPEGFGTLEQEPLVRQVVTDTLTGVPAADL